MNPQEITEKLQAPFPAEDIEWRVQRAMKTSKGDKAIVLAYVTNRAIMNRLDEVFGIHMWQNEFKEIHQGLLCGISVFWDGLWITKWDGADITNIEPTKGGLSGSMKRAAVQWGIGRYLYNLEENWVDVKEKGQNYINTKIKNNGKEEWIKGYWDTPTLPYWALPSGKREFVEDIPVDYSTFNNEAERAPSKATIKAKYQMLGWKMEEFESWYKGQREKFKDAQIDKFLTTQIAQKEGK